MELKKPVRIERPRFEPGTLAPGFYFYAGSAWGGGGIAARLGRHFAKDKTIHWHVDQLTVKARTICALTLPEGNECDAAAKLLNSGKFEIAVPGFGSSDCRVCLSHLLTVSSQSGAVD